MDTLELTCPGCEEEIFIELEEGMELEEGDIVECEHCGTYLELLSLDPLEYVAVEGGLEAYMVDCPRCETAIEVEEEGEPVTCPECGFTFTPDWSDIEEEDEEV